MVYGTYNFSPVPLLTLNKELQTKGDGTIIGAVFNATLNGTIYCPTGGLANVIAAQQTLREAFLQHGQLFKVSCDGSGLIEAYPRITGPEFQETGDNWVMTTKYNINLSWDDDLAVPTGSTENMFTTYVSDSSESWNVEFVEDKAKYDFTLPTVGADANPYQLRVSHSISAVGKKHYASGVLIKEAWEQARDYIIPRLGYNSTYVTSSGVLNLDSSLFSGYNHVRTNVADIAAGSFSVNESWLAVTPSGSGIAGRAIEDFTADVRKGIDSDLTTVSIQGTIQGLETRSYGTGIGLFNISETKYTAASGYWGNVNGRLYYRAQAFALAGTPPTRSLNIIPMSRVIGHNPSNGVITYSYEYNDRPMNCINGAITESINVVDNNPTDIFAEIPIPGRSLGPILQDMGTITSAKREVSIECIVAPPTGCGTAAFYVTNPRNDVNVIIAYFSGDLTSTYSQVFKHIDTESWDIKTGRYTHQVGWTYMNCS